MLSDYRLIENFAEKIYQRLWLFAVSLRYCIDTNNISSWISVNSCIRIDYGAYRLATTPLTVWETIRIVSFFTCLGNFVFD